MLPANWKRFSLALLFLFLVVTDAHAQKSFDGNKQSAVPSTGGYGLGPGGSRLTTPTVLPPSSPSNGGSSGGYSGGGYGGGGGYSAPSYSGPSQADIARQRRIAASRQANEQGIAAWNRRDYHAAVRYFQEAVSLDPNDRMTSYNYWKTKGQIALQNEDGDGAIEHYRRALQYSYDKLLADLVRDYDKPDSILRRRAYAAEKAGNWDDAAQLFGIASKRCKEFCDGLVWRYHHALGRRALQRGNAGLAVTELTEAILRQGKFLDEVLDARRKDMIDRSRATAAERRQSKDMWADIDAMRGRTISQTQNDLSEYRESLSLATQMQDKQDRSALGQLGPLRDAIADKPSEPPRSDTPSAKTVAPSTEGGAMGQARAAAGMGQEGAAQRGPDPTASKAPEAAASSKAAGLAGAVFDHGVAVPAAPTAVYVPSSSSRQERIYSFGNDLLPKLQASAAGRELIAKEEALHQDLSDAQETVRRLSKEPNAASNPDYSKALMVQGQVQKQLSNMRAKAEQVVTTVILKGPDTDAPLKQAEAPGKIVDRIPLLP